MNVNKVLTKEYEEKTLGQRGKKQSQTNPNKAKFKKAEMNVSSYITVGYEILSPIRAPKKQSQFSLTTKTNTNLYATKDYGNKPPQLREKTNPKQTQFQLSIMILSAAIIFEEFGVLLLTYGSKSRKLPALYSPLVLD